MDTCLLLVEDDEALGLVLEEALSRFGFEVLWAKSAEQAWEILFSSNPRLLVLDVRLPEGEEAGFELAQALREAGFLQPILFLTAKDGLDDRVHEEGTSGSSARFPGFGIRSKVHGHLSAQQAP